MSLADANADISAYFADSIAEFLRADATTILGRLTSASAFSVDLTQRDAWLSEIDLLKAALVGVDGSIFLEFDIPRLGSRIDGVVVTSSAVVPLEFKVGERKFTRIDLNQAWDYGLDLKNFHAASSSVPIFPVLCATAAADPDVAWSAPHADGVYPPRRANSLNVREAIVDALAVAPVGSLDPMVWGRSPYQPSPTIIEAARALYARHSVEAIARSDAGARNLHATSRTVERIINESRKRKTKSIVFVTGVPGAGKRLVGLNIATQHRGSGENHAVFLSGNGPLVAVLREALVQDELRRQRDAGGRRERKGEIEQRVKPFIQNVHHFRDDAVRDRLAPPAEHIAIFDEAQRAWNREKTSRFMRQRKRIDGFDHSEPEFLLSYMNRHTDWATVVCLVGGGQEIHDGEAGISAWLDAVRDHFPHWQVHISSELYDTEYAAGEALTRLGSHSRVDTERSLHLATSMRSFRSEQVSRFVMALLDSDMNSARSVLGDVLRRYPVVVTRDRNAARKWVRTQARGSERYGLVASSQAERLKAYCIDVRVDVDPVKYFLADATDTRSSYYLEDAATEFQTQGLELDWTVVSWDADLRRKNGEWSYHTFRGDRWINVNKSEKRQYLLNAYRVLLTRARQGMVLFVPPGRRSDPTIKPEFYDETFQYLVDLGVPVL